MLTKFKTYLNEKGLVSNSDRILVAVSGGLDSMVLLDLFRQTNSQLVVAHCNFQLRNEESDLDEKLVQKRAEELGLPFRSICFDILDHSKQTGLSIQETARKLRYDWFEQLLKEENCTQIALAHHLDDQVETVLINLSRGTGIHGMKGMLPSQGMLIRPLLFATKEEIRAYAELKGLQWREDASNAEDKYLRNHLRLNVIPELKKYDKKNFFKVWKSNCDRFSQESDFFSAVMNELMDTCLSKEKVVCFHHDRYPSHYPLLPFLRHWLSPLGFNTTQCENMESVLRSKQSGKIFSTENLTIYSDRNSLFLVPKSSTETFHLTINSEKELLALQSPCTCQLEEDFVLANMVPGELVIPIQKIAYPITITNWAPGDKFTPFGMKGMKKVADFLIDQKVSVWQKKSVLLFKIQGEIAGIIGYRGDERFRAKLGEKVVKIVSVDL